MERCFVACMKDSLRQDMEGKSRLYAYPMAVDKPTAGEFVILDSGAYGLSQRGMEIDAEHMFKLARYYKANGASNRFAVLGIAPDKFLDPEKTMDNYRFWHKYIQQPVVPVIQFKAMKKIDLHSGLRQVDFYLPGNRIMAISNPGLKARQAKAMHYLIEYMRKVGVEWIHNLGAGWNTLDCRDWFEMGFDSIDSIAYYTDADKGITWRPASYETGKTNQPAKNIILNNHILANSYAPKRTN